MKRRSLCLIIGMFLVFLQSRSFSANVTSSLEYRVFISEPHTHYFDVEILLKNPQGKYVDFKMPVWTPGSYLIREYSKNVERFQAVLLKGDTKLNFAKQNKSTWRVELQSTDDIAIKYRVYAFEGNVRMSYLDEDQAFIMANTLLMYVDELKSSSSILKLSYPGAWNSLSTSLSRLEGSENSFYVPNYDILVDSPIEIGNHEIINFTAAGVEHEVAMVGRVEFDKDQLIRDLSQIIESATAIFQDNPNDKYTFIIQTNKNSGGLEHLSSTVIGVDRWTFIDQKKYNYFLSLAAHEYFHLWLVKRLKPVELTEINYEKEVYTDMLWVMEGFTDYYSKKIMFLCGFYSQQKFINSLLYQMASLRNLPGSEVQTVANASYDTWIKYYRKNENSHNNQVSYYDKGLVLAALLDLQIISGSEGEKSLNDVINHLYYQFYKKKGKGISSKDLKKECESAGNMDFTYFFAEYIYGTKDLDYEKYLLLAGIDLVETNSGLSEKSLGLSYADEGERLIVTGVNRGGTAFENGLNTGDELIAINNYRLDKNNYQIILNNCKEGDRAKILIARQGLVLERELDIRYSKAVSYTYELHKDRTKMQIKTFNTWLGKQVSKELKSSW